MTDRIPGAPGRCKAVVTGEELQKMQSGEEFAITLRRDDQPIKEGTPYSKAAVLPDALAGKICPGLQDPTPGDAFAALQSQKADTVRQGKGTVITLQDAAYTPLMGLKLYGRTTPVAPDSGGDVTVTVMGKNILPLNEITFTGTYYYKLEKPIPAGNYYYRGGNITTTGTTSTCLTMFLNNGTSVCSIQKEPGSTNDTPISLTSDVTDIYFYAAASHTDAKGHEATYKDIMISADGGDYEPYKEPQILTVPTPNGLHSDGDVCDEIDFANGVLIYRVTENQEYPLSEEVLAAYAKLHTYSPTTVITNDAGADMEIIYYTPSTAVQMVHSPADKDKLLSVDNHGCVILVERESITEKAMSALEQLETDVRNLDTSDGALYVALSRHEEDTGNPHHVTADQLDMADFVVEQDTSGDWKWRIWKSGVAECWGEMSVSAEGSTGNTDHCNLFSDLPLYFTHFDSVQVTVLSTDPTDPGDSQYADVLTNLVMSVYNIDAEAELERLVVRFGIISAGSYKLLDQAVSNVRLSVRVSGTMQ